MLGEKRNLLSVVGNRTRIPRTIPNTEFIKEKLCTLLVPGDKPALSLEIKFYRVNIIRVCFFYRCPDHRTCHRISRGVWVSYPINLL
jgi:hypothetical protein